MQDHDTIDQLAHARLTRSRIADALALVMERDGLSQSAAWTALQRSSQQRNVRLVVLAEQILSGEQNTAPRVAHSA